LIVHIVAPEWKSVKQNRLLLLDEAPDYPAIGQKWIQALLLQDW